MNTDAIRPIVAETDNPLPTVALSIRQPWAWLIVHGPKDVENRTWPTKFRGRFLVHAAKAFPKADELDCAWQLAQASGVDIPDPYNLDYGGIIGEATLFDCLTTCESLWHAPGQWGFVLTNRKPLPFMSCRGYLNFFTPDLH